MDQKGLRIVFLYQKYPFLRKLCLLNIRFPEVIILNDLGHRGSPTINLFPGALVVGDAWGKARVCGHIKGKRQKLISMLICWLVVLFKSWYCCWFSYRWWCLREGLSMWTGEGRCGRVDRWTGWEKGDSRSWVDRVLKSLLRKFESKSKTVS